MKNNQPSYSWMNPKLAARKTSKAGMSIYTKEPISKNEQLAVFGGRVMTIDDESKLPKKIQDYSLQISEDLVIGIYSKEFVGPAEFFNHSCQPNAGFDGQIFLVAMRNIKPGEEITFDYAMTIAGDEPYKLECMCGNKNCRGFITNLDWKKRSLQKKYNGYFQWYIQKLINKTAS